MIIQKDSRKLEVTEKAYRVIYKDLGYVEADTEQNDTEEMSVPQLKKRAKELNIDGYSSMNKKELIKAIKE